MIAFLSVRDGVPRIYVMNADGSGQRRLKGTQPDEASTVWSPDGRKIAFVARSSIDTPEIYVVNADGSGNRNVTRHPEAGSLHPVWSPDGRQIAFESYRDGNKEVYVMNADGSGQRNLSKNGAVDGDPDWSPVSR